MGDASQETHLVPFKITPYQCEEKQFHQHNLTKATERPVRQRQGEFVFPSCQREGGLKTSGDD